MVSEKVERRKGQGGFMCCMLCAVRFYLDIPSVGSGGGGGGGGGRSSGSSISYSARNLRGTTD